MLKATITFLPVRSACVVDDAHHGRARAASNGQCGAVGLQLVVLDEVDAGLAQLATSSAVCSADRPTLGLMIVPTSGPLARRSARRVPAMPSAGHARSARDNAAGTLQVSSRRPVTSPRS